MNHRTEGSCESYQRESCPTLTLPVPLNFLGCVTEIADKHDEESWPLSEHSLQTWTGSHSSMAGYRERGSGDQKIREKNLGSGFHKLHFLPSKLIKKYSVAYVIFRGEMGSGQ